MVADVKPSEKCKDRNCPFHGNIKVRGRTFTGIVVGTKMHRAVTVEWIEKKYISKYERSEKRRTKVHAHLPPCIDIKLGDRVELRETRPLSKTKHFVIIKKVEKKEGKGEEKK